MKLFKNKKKQKEDILNEYICKLNDTGEQIENFIRKFIDGLIKYAPTAGPFSEYFRRTLDEKDLFNTIYTGKFKFKDEEFNNILEERFSIKKPKFISSAEHIDDICHIFFPYYYSHLYNYYDLGIEIFLSMDHKIEITINVRRTIILKNIN